MIALSPGNVMDVDVEVSVEGIVSTQTLDARIREVESYGYVVTIPDNVDFELYDCTLAVDFDGNVLEDY